jgi:hypothetical protein
MCKDVPGECSIPKQVPTSDSRMPECMHTAETDGMQ